MMLSDRAAIYNLTQNFGGPGTLYARGTSSVNSETGIRTETITPYKIKRIIKLPEKFIWQFTPISQGGQKPFTVVQQVVPFMFMGNALPKGVTAVQGNYIVMSKDGQGYTIESVLDTSFPDIVLCMCKKMSGDVPRRVIDLHLTDRLHLSDSLETA